METIFQTDKINALSFMLGVFVQSIAALRGKRDWFKIGIAVLIALGMIIFSQSGNIGNGYSIPFYFAIVYPFIFFGKFREQIYPKISELNVLQLTLIFWYYIFITHSWAELKENTAVLIAIPPTIGAFYCAFFKFDMSGIWKAFMYAWYLAMMLVMVSAQIIPVMQDVSILGRQQMGELFVMGAAFSFAVMCFLMLFSLFGNNKEKEDEPDEDPIFDKCFSDNQLKIGQTILIIIFQGGMLAFNYFYHLINYFFMINLSIIALHIILSMPKLKIISRSKIS